MPLVRSNEHSPGGPPNAVVSAPSNRVHLLGRSSVPGEGSPARLQRCAEEKEKWGVRKPDPSGQPVLRTGPSLQFSSEHLQTS